MYVPPGKERTVLMLASILSERGALLNSRIFHRGRHAPQSRRICNHQTSQAPGR
jgi:hypothetical protein